MSEDVPGPTPEGQLIRRVRDLSIPRLTIRAAAERIGLSAEQWGYIERGYRPARAGEPPRPFSPPAATLAKMARALRITPERLESEGQRPDAAEILREILHREVEAADAATPAALPVPGEPPGWMASDEARTAANRPYADQIRGRLNLLRGQGIPSPSGAQLFPDSPADARDWDKYADDWEDRDVVWFIADLQRRAAGRNRPVNTG
jgi:transcriptional regulator with XRE-family HTH domain